MNLYCWIVVPMAPSITMMRFCICSSMYALILAASCLPAGPHGSSGHVPVTFSALSAAGSGLAFLASASLQSASFVLSCSTTRSSSAASISS